LDKDGMDLSVGEVGSAFFAHAPRHRHQNIASLTQNVRGSGILTGKSGRHFSRVERDGGWNGSPNSPISPGLSASCSDCHEQALPRH